MCVLFFFFFKQNTAYVMRISDWTSDVCSSDLFWESQKYKTAKVVLGDVDPSQKEADVTPVRVGRGCLKGIRMLHLRRRFYKCKFAGAIDRKSTRLNSSH